MQAHRIWFGRMPGSLNSGINEHRSRVADKSDAGFPQGSAQELQVKPEIALKWADIDTDENRTVPVRPSVRVACLSWHGPIRAAGTTSVSPRRALPTAGQRGRLSWTPDEGAASPPEDSANPCPTRSHRPSLVQPGRAGWLNRMAPRCAPPTHRPGGAAGPAVASGELPL